MTAAAGTVLSAHGLRKDYGKDAALVRAVDNVSLTVAQGESVAIVGPSGCGKSTLLYLVGGLERPTAGTIELAGEAIDHMPEAGLARLRRRQGHPGPDREPGSGDHVLRGLFPRRGRG